MIIVNNKLSGEKTSCLRIALTKTVASRLDRLQSKIQEQQSNDNCNRIGVSRNFMYSKVTSKTTSLIKMIIELKAVCREISYIESSLPKKVEKLCLKVT